MKILNKKTIGSFFLLFFLFFSSVWANEQDVTNINFTEVEKKWLQNHPIIHVANEVDWPPFDFNESGTPKGLAIDYIKLLAKNIGVEIDFVYGYTWVELVELFKQKKIDVMPVFYKNIERESFTLYTNPYHRGKLGIFINKDNKTGKIDLINKNVGMETSHGSIPLVKKIVPGIIITEVDSKVDLVRKLATKELDVIIGNPFVFYYLAKENQIDSIQLSSYIEMNEEEQSDTSLHIGIRKDLPVLHQILQKAMQNVSDEEMEGIKNKWTDITIVNPVNWVLVFQACIVIIVIVLFLFWHNRKLKSMVAAKTIELKKLNEDLESKVEERTKELTESNKALTDSEEMYRSLSDAAFEGIVITKKGIILQTNDTFCKMVGYQSSELIDKKGADLVPHEEKERVQNKILSGYEQPYESSIVRKDGSTVPIEVHAKMFSYKGQQVRVTAVRDITEQKKAEEELKKLGTAIRQSPVTIVITDLAGNIEYVNPKFCKLTGYSAEEVLGKNPRILNSGKMPKETYDQLWETITAGKDWHGELYNKKKNGNFYWEKVIITPILNENDSVTHFLGIKEDITERKQAEIILIEHEKLQGVLEMAGAVCHEINQPLMALVGYLELLEMKVSETNQQDSSFEKINTQLKRVNAIITKLMQITKYETKDYIQGTKIIDIEKSAEKMVEGGLKKE